MSEFSAMTTSTGREAGRDDTTSHVAVIGLACRFPGARDADEFWRNLLGGVDSITRRATPRGRVSRGLLADPERFDAGYFGLSPREARLIDPQHRVFLECAVAALENAGYDPARQDGSIGVYAGAGENGYAQLIRDVRDSDGAGRGPLSTVSDWEIRVANGADFLCSRVAHRLGLRGPTVAVQAACATSLVAVHLAVRGLLNGECDLALAGGVTVRLPSPADPSDEVGINAPDGVCRAFDAGARGLVGGDGVGIVVLKRLADAVADGDRVDAVIRGSAVNNDGADRIGFTAPGVDGQAAVIESAQRAAGVDAGTCTYVEAHGTGTPLGDPVEISALTRAFRRDTDRRGFCWIGSVKTNIGHTDAAAGVAGLIKTVLALKHAVLPPSLHFETPNPQIDFAASPFRVVTRPRRWQPPDGLPRRAGVSAFSVGGTNAHVVLEQAPAPRRPASPPDRWYLLPLSARTPEALAAVTGRLAGHLRADPALPLADVAWTLQTGRREHGHRRFALVRGHADAVRVLDGAEPDRLVTAPAEARPRPVLFRFPAGGRLTEHGTGRRRFERLYHCARLWRQCGIEPDAVQGEGAGALAAAAVAGVFRPADAVRLMAAAADGAGEGQLADLVRRVGPRAPSMPLMVGGTRRMPAAQAADPEYWAACLSQAAADNDRLPGSALRDDPGRIVLDLGAVGVPGADHDILRTLGDLWLSGARIDWSAPAEGRRPGRVALPTYPFEGQRHTVVGDEPVPRRHAPAPAPAPPEGTSTLDAVTALFAEILQLPEVEPDESFFDLGGDSLIAARFVARAREVLPVELVPRTLFEAPTASGLAALIEDRMGRAVPRKPTDRAERLAAGGPR
ncbi:beta-ketoacyl synthase N-terminal-like domain-containing protein [Streptomyces griseoluteus]|uniref:type I polyketide synthase n=1 Tax=Streptomyces griseoluteus TaxID=29306 RepID=UPI0034033783